MKRLIKKLKTFKKRRDYIRDYKIRRKELIAGYVFSRKTLNIKDMEYYAERLAWEEAVKEGMLEA